MCYETQDLITANYLSLKHFLKVSKSRAYPFMLPIACACMVILYSNIKYLLRLGQKAVRELEAELWSPLAAAAEYRRI